MQLGHRGFDVAIDLPRILSFDFSLQSLKIRHDLIHLSRLEILTELHAQIFVLQKQGADRLDRELHIFAHRFALPELRLLRHIANGLALGEARNTVKLLVYPGHDFEQGRLAGAVLTDDANLRVLKEHQTDVLQHRLLVLVALGEPFDGENWLVTHGCPLEWAEQHKEKRPADPQTRHALVALYLARVLSFLDMIGGSEMLILLVIGLLMYGRDLPQVGRKVGNVVAQLRRGMNDFKDQIDRESSVRDLKQTVQETLYDIRRVAAVPRVLMDPANAVRQLAEQGMQSIAGESPLAEAPVDHSADAPMQPITEAEPAIEPTAAPPIEPPKSH